MQHFTTLTSNPRLSYRHRFSHLCISDLFRVYPTELNKCKQIDGQIDSVFNAKVLKHKTNYLVGVRN